MSSLPNADKLSFDASRYSYNNIRKVLPDLSDKVGSILSHSWRLSLFLPINISVCFVCVCDQGIDLINRLLTYDPSVRISVSP